MHLSRLRLAGFKTFADPAEVLIEPGLTGLVGPNGCGKSNLVEALRWAMGETSYRSMRASGMEDVIFSGSARRPARDSAEVTLVLDNDTRTAPAAYNGEDTLEVSRRIARASGSAYRVNGREARARDVQLLFADASTGARSPSMVGQGRVAELIAARPQARRAILEEAAGISGLHGRRHEAEIRLRAAEANLERIDDVVRGLDGQLDALRRQSRQALRYRRLSAEIRALSALMLWSRWRIALEAEGEAEAALTAAAARVAAASARQGEAVREEAVLAHRLPALREADTAAAARVAALQSALARLDAERERATRRRAELDARRRQVEADLARERVLAGDNSDMLGRLEREERSLRAAGEGAGDAARQAEERVAATAAGLAVAEARRTAAAEQLAGARARREAALLLRRQAGDRASRLSAAEARLREDLAALERQGAAPGSDDAAREALAALEARHAAALEARAEADAAAGEARAALSATEGEAAAATAALRALDGEAAAVRRQLEAGGARGRSALEACRVRPGDEAALAAALGPEGGDGFDTAAPSHWTTPASADLMPLPEGVEPLLARVEAPAELAARLAMTGLVAAADGARLQARLRPGQRLVSPEGRLWRWDGHVADGRSGASAAQRLAARNRLAELEETLAAARSKAAGAAAAAGTARAGLDAASRALSQRREAADRLARESEEARRRQAVAEAERLRLASRRDALRERLSEAADAAAEAAATLASAEDELAAAGDPAAFETTAREAGAALATARTEAEAARAAADRIAREGEARSRRLAAIDGERDAWLRRAANAATQAAALEQRLAQAVADRAALEEDGETDPHARARLSREIAEAEGARKAAAAALADHERATRAAEAGARAALVALSEAREASARAEERLSGAVTRRADEEARIRTELDCEPAAARALAEHPEDAPVPALAELERRLEGVRAERERLGAVNLRAESELSEIEGSRGRLAGERDDLAEAVRKLRGAIASLNEEGRGRLLEAFGRVNEAFRQLFTRLFEGGTAELTLVESDDPLEAGLEILARPPGKKPVTMTLLSGGEQALTALAVIFAVFLTNPSPICVLDEVDAPLDDHNVVRFCDLLAEMARQTQTRFLVVTHNPLTMARMDRLFGVTMAEQGVSQLVSVDLATAEALREAG